MSELPSLLTAWLLTYVVHSTVLLVLACGLERLLPSGDLRGSERIWRFALLAGILTATLRPAVGLDDVEIGLPGLGAREVVARVAPPAPDRALAELAAATQGPWSPPPQESAPPALGTYPTEPRGPSATAPPTSQATLSVPLASRSLPSLRGVLPALWLVVGGLLLARLGGRWARLALRLRLRQTVGGPLRHRLEALCDRAGVRRAILLSASDRVAVPFAYGLRRPEICLPTPALHGLDRDEQEAVLAHELAHLVRRDPAWLVVSQLCEAVLFLQPLNRLARRRLQAIAELRCDDWAVAELGQRMPLARCLTTVAGWQLEPGPRRRLALAQLAAQPSELRRRIERLLHPGGTMTARSPRWLTPLCAGLFLFTLLAVPGVSTLAPPPPQEPLGSPPPAPAAPHAPQAPPAPELPPTPPAPEALEAPPAPAANSVAPAAPEAAPAPPTGAPAVAPKPPKPPVVVVAALVPAPVAAPAPVLRARPAPAQEPEGEAEAATSEAEAGEHEVENDVENEVEWHEIEEEVEDTLAPELEALTRELEAALAPLEAELGAQLEAIGREIDAALELHLDGVLEELHERLDAEGDLDGEDEERLREEIEAIERSVAAVRGSVARDVMTSLRPALDAAELGRRISESVAPIVQRIDAEALARKAAELAHSQDSTRADAERLRAEARRMAEQARPTEAELARLRAEAARMATEMRVPQEALEKMRAELEARLEIMRTELESARRKAKERQE